MAINFEAANMAGYNNPKIEVFKATPEVGTDTLISAPSKSKILRCLTRGSIPAILLTYTYDGGSEAHLLYVDYWIQDAGGDTISFRSASSLVITYNPDGEQPVFTRAAG